MRRLSASRIAQAIESECKNNIKEIFVLDEIDSTNSFLLSKPFYPQQSQLCVTESQSAGKGRYGNVWESEKEQNILMSFSWQFTHEVAYPQTLSLVVSLLLCEVLNQQYGVSAAIKWPNDILINAEKVAGILVESQMSNQGARNVVIGVGVNISQQNNSALSASGYAWTDLKKQGATVDRNQLIGHFFSQCVAMLRDFYKRDFIYHQTRWNALCIHYGRAISLRYKEQYLRGTMQGVNAKGELLLQQGDNMLVIDHSGVHVRLIEVQV